MPNYRDQAVRKADPDYQKMNREALEGLEAQEDVYDKIWYAVNYQALAGAISDGYRTREKYEEEKMAIPEDLSIPEEEKDYLFYNDVADDVLQETTPWIYDAENLEEQKRTYQKLGMMNAKIGYDLGKEYKKWLDTMPADDPDRQAKAEYLALNGVSDATFREKGYKVICMDINRSIFDATEDKYMLSFLGDAEAFHQMTMREYFDQALMDSREAQEFLKAAAEGGIEADLDSNAYDFFEKRYRLENYTDQWEKDGHSIKVPEESILKYTFRQYYRTMVSNWQKMGEQLILNNMAAEEKELAQIGIRLSTTNEYKPPKSIREWVEKEAKPMIAASRLEKANDAVISLTDQVDTLSAYQIVKDEVFASAFQQIDRPADGYDDYIRQNLSAEVLNLSYVEQRERVARVLAADALRENHIEFNEATIESRAEDFAKNPKFMSLSNREIGEMITNRGRGVRKLRRELTTESFAVEEAIIEEETAESELKGQEPDARGSKAKEPQEKEEIIDEKKLDTLKKNVEKLEDQKQRMELYGQSLDAAVKQSKRYLESLKKLAEYKSGNSDEFQRMERTLETVTKISRNLNPQQIEDAFTELGAAAKTYKNMIDSSWHKGLSQNGQDRRNFAEILEYFVSTQKNSLHTLGRKVFSPDYKLDRQIQAADRWIEEAKFALEDAETKAAIQAVEEMKAKEAKKPQQAKETEEARNTRETAGKGREPEQDAHYAEAMDKVFEKVDQAMTREEEFRANLDPEAPDYKDKLMESAQRSLFIQTTVDACERNVERIGSERSAQIMNKTMDKMLSAPDGNCLAFKAFRAEFLDKKLFNEHFEKQVMDGAENGRVSEEDMVTYRDNALKEAFNDRRAEPKVLNKLSATLGSKVNSDNAIKKEQKVIKEQKTQLKQAKPMQ